jgi:hypothetical protein
MLLVSSTNWIEELAGSDQTSAETISKAKQLRQYVQPWVFGHFIIVLAAMITGTISYAGSFPLVHGVLGISLLGVGLANLIVWIRFAVGLTNR